MFIKDSFIIFRWSSDVSCIYEWALKYKQKCNWPSPKFLTSWELSTGPSCWGSPANTSWPILGHFLVVSIPAMAIRASGSLACPHSSMKTKSNMPCIPPVTSLYTTYNTFTLLTPALIAFLSLVSTAECVRPNRQNSSVRELNP